VTVLNLFNITPAQVWLTQTRLRRGHLLEFVIDVTLEIPTHWTRTSNSSKRTRDIFN